jgi:hypothetical protein
MVVIRCEIGDLSPTAVQREVRVCVWINYTEASMWHLNITNSDNILVAGISHNTELF